MDQKKGRIFEKRPHFSIGLGGGSEAPPRNKLVDSYRQRSGWADSNRRPLGPEPSALATALQPEKKAPRLFAGLARETGATGLEPAISGLTGRRDNQLRHAPVTEMNYSQKGF